MAQTPKMPPTRNDPCERVEQVLHRYRGPMLHRSKVYETDMRILVVEIDRLRAENDQLRQRLGIITAELEHGRGPRQARAKESADDRHETC